MFDALIAAVSSPIETIKALLNEWVVDFINRLLRWDVPGPPGTISEIVWGGHYEMPELAAGGIATGRDGVVAEVGEAGSPELIQPLTPASVQANLGPLLAGIEMPGLESAVAWLERIHGVLTGTLHVESVGGQAPAERARDIDDLAAVPGIMGTAMGRF